mgnify:CR=1 FL=1
MEKIEVQSFFRVFLYLRVYIICVSMACMLSPAKKGAVKKQPEER